MLEELEYRTDKDQYGNIYGLLPPSNREIIEKLNEVIRVLNELLGRK